MRHAGDLPPNQLAEELQVDHASSVTLMTSRQVDDLFAQSGVAIRSGSRLEGAGTHVDKT